MPIKHRVLPDCSLIVSEHIGKVTDHECLTSYRELYGKDEGQMEYDHLVDLTRTTSDERSASGLRDLAKMTRGLFKGYKTSSKIAVIAPMKLSFGLSRMYGTLAEDTIGDYSVFKSIDEAVLWLGISKESVLSKQFHISK